MSFRGFLAAPSSLPKPIFSSPAISLGLESNSEAEMLKRFAEVGAGGSKEDEYDSRSGSENVDGGSGDDLDADQPRKKKRYHRHTPHQIQELEALFKECPHPDEKQRQELSRRLRLESRQIKFWFQNRRTQMKAQLERHQNSLLKQENDRLKMENMAIRESTRNPLCLSCGGSVSPGDVSFEHHQLRLENARLKDELSRVSALAERFLSHPLANSFQDLADFFNQAPERTILEDLAMVAMDELMKMAEMEEPLWSRNASGKWVLNSDQYMKISSQCLGPRPSGFVSEVSRETAVLVVGASVLVETLMDANRWPGMFPCLVARTSSDVIAAGDGVGNGALHLVRAELQVLSPLVPTREVCFLRFSKQHADGLWAVVDVSVGGNPSGPATSRRLPSGCLLREMPNGLTKVTWVEHTEYEESAIHSLHRPLLRSGAALGAQRWLGAMQRQCECLALLLSSSNEPSAISAVGRRSMVKLASRMTENLCSGVCASSAHRWARLSLGGAAVGENVRVMTRSSEASPGETPGVVLSAATSVWIPVAPRKLFDFLRDESLRSEWDILSNGAPMQEVARIAKGRDHGNSVSLLRACAVGSNQTSMLILQETCTDPAASLVVYAPVDTQSMQLVMNGGDSSSVALLPSGFAVMPDGLSAERRRNGGADVDSPAGGASLLTVAFQILVNSLPAAKLTVESAETVNNLISCTIKKIKEALHCEG